MTDTWRCGACGKPVPAECNGKCNAGTTAERTGNK